MSSMLTAYRARLEAARTEADNRAMAIHFRGGDQAMAQAYHGAGNAYSQALAWLDEATGVQVVQGELFRMEAME